METSRRTASGERRVEYIRAVLSHVRYYLGWKLAVPSSRPFLRRPPRGSYRRSVSSFSLFRYSLIRKKSSIAIMEQRLLADFLKTVAVIELAYAPLPFKSRQHCRSVGNKQTGREPFDPRPTRPLCGGGNTT